MSLSFAKKDLFIMHARRSKGSDLRLERYSASDGASAPSHVVVLVIYCMELRLYLEIL
jgi:hypothetical protein